MTAPALDPSLVLSGTAAAAGYRMPAEWERLACV
jgi:hypothetical protein